MQRCALYLRGTENEAMCRTYGVILGIVMGRVHSLLL